MPEKQLDFICAHCGKKVYHSDLLGNHQRNHCPYCLWSQHEDLNTAGDRQSLCHGLMEPIGLTFKTSKYNKYGSNKVGEILLIHRCTKCGKISLNHLAADDDEEEIIKIFQKSLTMNSDLKKQLLQDNIIVLEEKDLSEVKRQLYGK